MHNDILPVYELKPENPRVRDSKIIPQIKTMEHRNKLYLHSISRYVVYVKSVVVNYSFFHSNLISTSSLSLLGLLSLSPSEFI